MHYSYKGLGNPCQSTHVVSTRLNRKNLSFRVKRLISLVCLKNIYMIVSSELIMLKP